MKLLKRIYRCKGINLQGKVNFRTAVRGIIPSGNKLLMIYSTARGDYKFPGGGVDAGETHEQALAREIREECGATTTRIGPGFGKVLEYDNSIEAGFDTFKMASFYYWCEIETIFQPQMLEDYEADLGFKPVWVSPDTAIQKNRQLLSTASDQEIFWLKRETFILEQIARQHDQQLR
jgi:8-oxo-dGTP pyrophosphatase MutT (NUDIX family)